MLWLWGCFTPRGIPAHYPTCHCEEAAASGRRGNPHSIPQYDTNDTSKGERIATVALLPHNDRFGGAADLTEITQNSSLFSGKIPQIPGKHLLKTFRKLQKTGYDFGVFPFTTRWSNNHKRQLINTTGEITAE